MSSWTQDEEINLIKNLRNKLTIEQIAQKHNRDIKSIELRIQKIIYENIVNNGKSINTISKIMNLNENDIMKYYNKYKELKDDYVRKEKKQKIEKIEKNYDVVENKNDENKKFENAIMVLERENKFIKLLFENKILQKRLSEEIAQGRISENIRDFIKQLRNTK